MHCPPLPRRLATTEEVMWGRLRGPAGEQSPFNLLEEGGEEEEECGNMQFLPSQEEVMGEGVLRPETGQGCP